MKFISDQINEPKILVTIMPFSKLFLIRQLRLYLYLRLIGKHMKHFRYFFLLLISILFLQRLDAQVDTEFWFAAPEVSIHNAQFDVPIYLNITAIDKNATVTVSIPANNSIAPISKGVLSGTSVRIDISHLKDQIENTPADQILNKGIYVVATEMVQIYYDVASTYCGCNPELFTLKGRNALGTSFYIPSQTTIDNRGFYQPKPTFSFDIVASENNTKVTINPSKDLVGHSANVPYSITLNKGQTYSAASPNITGSSHPAGSYVYSDKPIAITIKDDLLDGTQFGGACADLTGDQIVPIELTGKNYIVVRGKLGIGNQKDLVCITATKNNTEIKAAGSVITTIHAGQNYTYELTSNNVYIETSEPVYVLHISGIGCELGSALLPSVKCTGSKLLGLRRSASTSFFLDVNVIVPKGAENSFKVNGQSGIIKASHFQTIPGTTEFLTAAIRIDSNIIHTNQSMIITNDAGFFHLGIFAGNLAGGTAYGYISNYNRLVTAQKKKLKCSDTLVLRARNVGDSITWFNGSKNPTFKPGKIGIYWVDIYTQCESIRDSFIIDYTPSYRKSKTNTLCNNFMTLNPDNQADSFLWNTGSNKAFIDVTKAGKYWVNSYKDCKHQVDTFILLPNPLKPPIKKEIDCYDSLKLILTRSSDSFRWWNGSKDSTQFVSSIGTYWVEHYLPCEVIRDTIIVKYRNSVITKSRPFCENDKLLSITNPSRISIYTWSTGETSPYIIAKNSPVYWVDKISNCGNERDSFIAIKMHLPEDTIICGEVEILLDSKFDSTRWNGRTYSRYYTATKAGKYVAFYTSKYCTSTSDTFTIAYSDEALKVFIPNAFSPNDDGVNDGFQPYIDGVSKYRLRIFNRWGEELSDTESSSWDGKFKGNIVQEGTYLYMLEYYDCRDVYKFVSGMFIVIY